MAGHATGKDLLQGRRRAVGEAVGPAGEVQQGTGIDGDGIAVGGPSLTRDGLAQQAGVVGRLPAQQVGQLVAAVETMRAG